jgi:hypothetical protein
VRRYGFERQYWTVCLCFPLFAMAAIFANAAAAGCYALQGCFSWIASTTFISRCWFVAAASVRLGTYAGAPLVALALFALWRREPRAVVRWLWLTPLAFAVTFHVARETRADAILFNPEVRGSVASDTTVLAAGAGYIALAHLGERICAAWLGRRAARRRRW